LDKDDSFISLTDSFHSGESREEVGQINC
jgi:hypothetical protein